MYIFTPVFYMKKKINPPIVYNGLLENKLKAYLR